MWCCLVTIVQVRYYVVLLVVRYYVVLLLLSNHGAGKILCGVA